MLRQARDRQEIDELMWCYARALDTGDPEGYAALYTPDGQFTGMAPALPTTRPFSSPADSIQVETSVAH